ncbi:MAG: hypothetical protein ALECFALPRED_008251 [Alectoria fallacina]|uniref:Uncharacterized protein n=1 Tax=Alectoria fallacina TaxID=1903189 RepID=A0A8H3I2M5_9LECA|nr:MAG: hypothetical protein ALECFALPRED_008251 [Alectoria fallacina]
MSNPVGTVRQATPRHLVSTIADIGVPSASPISVACGPLKEQIVAAHGIALIVTAEPATHVAEKHPETEYGGDAIVDPENLLADELKKRGLLHVAISE